MPLHPEMELPLKFKPSEGPPSLWMLRPWRPPPPEVRREVKALLIQLFFASWRSLARTPFSCSSSCASNHMTNLLDTISGSRRSPQMLRFPSL